MIAISSAFREDSVIAKARFANKQPIFKDRGKKHGSSWCSPLTVFDQQLLQQLLREALLLPEQAPVLYATAHTFPRAEINFNVSFKRWASWDTRR